MCADPAPLVVTKQTLISVTQFADQSSLYEADAYLELQLAGAEVSDPDFGEMRRNSSDISKTFLRSGVWKSPVRTATFPIREIAPFIGRRWLELAQTGS
jgi:hypothetical protein